jgi:hypothetical protein
MNSESPFILGLPMIESIELANLHSQEKPDRQVRTYLYPRTYYWIIGIDILISIGTISRLKKGNPPLPRNGCRVWLAELRSDHNQLCTRIPQVGPTLQARSNFACA